jgi:hypothetical protein
MKKIFLTTGFVSFLALSGVFAQTNASEKGTMKPLTNQEKETERAAKEMPVDNGERKSVQQSTGMKSNSDSSVLSPGTTSAMPAEDKKQPEELKKAPR